MNPRRSHCSSPTRTAFTLIELLVVIAIIAILAAILFPVFAQAREKARAIACISNTKQMGIALMLYAQDFDETLPIDNYGVWNGFIADDARSPKWMDMLYPYVKNAQVFTCPSFAGIDKHFLYINQPSDLPIVRGGPFYGSYVLNGAYYAETAVSAHGPAHQSLAAIAATADTIFATETGAPGLDRNAIATWRYDLVNPTVVKTSSPPTLNTNQGVIVYLRHSLGANSVFCDGHAKWKTGDAMVATHPVGPNKVPICYLWTIEDD